MESKFTGSYRSHTQSVLESDSDSSGSDSGQDVWKRSSRKRVTSSSPIKTVDAEFPLSTDENNSCNLKKRKLNTVWCNVLQEQTVADDLVQFGLKPKPITYQDRSCENYDFRQGALDPRRQEEASAMEDDSLCSKDNCDETNLDEDNNKRSGQKNSPQFRWPKSVRESRDVVDKVAKKIIRVLSEPKHHIIYKVVQVLGSTRSLELLEETEKIEEDGGMYVVDNSRRRTPGGIFLQLIKKDDSVSKKKKSIIFAEDRKMMGKLSKKHFKKKKGGKNHLESMDIVFEPAEHQDSEAAAAEQNDSSNGSSGTSSNDDNGVVTESNGTGPNKCNGDGSSCNNVIHITELESNACAKEDSELEEGEITD